MNASVCYTEGLMRARILLTILILTACPAEDDGTAGSSTSSGDEPLDCASAQTEAACGMLQPQGSSSVAGCAWVEVRTVDATCSAPPSDPVGTCIQTEYIGEGCRFEPCNDQTGRLFARPNDAGGFEVFETMLCGNEPAGFTECTFTGDDPAGCGCLCEALGGPDETSSSSGSSSSTG